MLARAVACSVHGLAGVPVTVEADIANGLPNFTVVGLTDRAIQEARERVRASIRNSGFEFPQRRLTVNLAPAEVPKEGTGFDLAIAMAILRLGNLTLRLDGVAFIGELALDGSVRPVTGVLPMARCLSAAGVRHLAVAEENAAEAALVDYSRWSASGRWRGAWVTSTAALACRAQRQGRWLPSRSSPTSTRCVARSRPSEPWRSPPQAATTC